MKLKTLALALLAIAPAAQAADSMSRFAGMARVTCGYEPMTYAAVLSEDLTSPAFVNRWHVLVSIPDVPSDCLRPLRIEQATVGGCSTERGYTLEVVELGLAIELVPGDPGLWPSFAIVHACEFRHQNVTLSRAHVPTGAKYIELLVEEPIH
jgi:hypothetical protein